MKQVKSAFCLENADLIFLLKHRFYRGDFMLKFADAHCDTITKLRPQQLALGCDTTLAHLDLPRLQEGTQLQFMAFFCSRRLRLRPGRCYESIGEVCGRRLL